MPTATNHTFSENIFGTVNDDGAGATWQHYAHHYDGDDDDDDDNVTTFDVHVYESATNRSQWRVQFTTHNDASRGPHWTVFYDVERHLVEWVHNPHVARHKQPGDLLFKYRVRRRRLSNDTHIDVCTAQRGWRYTVLSTRSRLHTTSACTVPMPLFVMCACLAPEEARHRVCYGSQSNTNYESVVSAANASK